MPTFTFSKPIDDIEEPQLLEEDWYLAEISATPTLEKNKKMEDDPNQEGAGYNLVVKVKLIEGEALNRRFNLYLPWPSVADEDAYDGVGMKVSDAKMQRIANFTTKFGGIADGTDVVLEEGMRGYLYVLTELAQDGQTMRNNVDTFRAGFKSVEDLLEEEESAPSVGLDE